MLFEIVATAEPESEEPPTEEQDERKKGSRPHEKSIYFYTRDADTNSEMCHGWP